MERSEIKEQVLEVFIDVFGDELSCAGGGALDEYTSPESFGPWDSLSDVNLILALERRFNLHFSLGELDSMRSIGMIIDVIKMKMEM